MTTTNILENEIGFYSMNLTFKISKSIDSLIDIDFVSFNLMNINLQTNRLLRSIAAILHLEISCFSHDNHKQQIQQCLRIPLSFGLVLKTTKNCLQLLGQKTRSTEQIVHSVIHAKTRENLIL